MRFTTYTDFALRTLMYLAAVKQRSKAQDVARTYGISAHHVAKVVNQLARLGYVRSVRGIGGGIELARDPADIPLGEVISAFEGSTHLLDCVEIENVCSIQSFCKLSSILAEAERVQMEFLNRVSLQDVVPTRRQLQKVVSD